MRIIRVIIITIKMIIITNGVALMFMFIIIDHCHLHERNGRGLGVVR